MKRFFYFLLNFIEGVILRRPLEKRLAFYKEYWPWVAEYNLHVGDLIRWKEKQYIILGLSKGPGYYSGDIAPFQFHEIPLRKNGRNIVFMHPSYCMLVAKDKVRHYSPKEFKEAKELFTEDSNPASQSVH